MFALLATSVAGYAFTHLYRPFQAGITFAAQFAVSDMYVPLHFFTAALALLLGLVQLVQLAR